MNTQEQLTPKRQRANVSSDVPVLISQYEYGRLLQVEHSAKNLLFVMDDLTRMKSAHLEIVAKNKTSVGLITGAIRELSVSLNITKTGVTPKNKLI